MIPFIHNLFHKEFPQNFILKKPLAGSFIFLLFCFGFVIVYKPLNAHKGLFLNYEATMAVYCVLSSLAIFTTIKIIKLTNYFSNKEMWTLSKEIISMFLVLSSMGITLFFSAFFIEIPAERWNLATFLNSYFNAFLIGIVPFAFFSLLNYLNQVSVEKIKYYKPDNNSVSDLNTSDEIIHIESKLKKEELNFYCNQFLYAESEGNYVIFYLNEENQVIKKMIRNSISNIEEQLTKIPFFIRTHRAFIVNTKKVSSQKGNSLGYKLKLTGIETEIPVSRQNVHKFNKSMKEYK